ncbi:hypothetical protein ARMGADRAFT_1091656 [Armillaria gallica]|uniref:Uncharacterized protein n=1 Tax=Armillaria gallica TaxID=47427 RepID=A0A2H3CPG6_ARMGA|nr:hypothetical protein ARMGADRAFT_1091656 [Armillaria gallica]
MSSQPSISLPSIGETFGACYIGSLIAAILYGISNLQVVLYYKRYANDWWVYRYSIAILWALDALHVAFSTHALYYYMIKMFGNVNGLDRILWSMKMIVLRPTHKRSLIGYSVAVVSDFYINSLLAMLNSRPKHHSTNPATQSGIGFVPVLRIPPHNSEGNVEETNISVSLQDIGSFTNKIDPLKEDLDCPV